ncbi:unnamed protein product [Linum tenue]|uniref:Uncharacterized protein n=1 Tax=Linum tenue TaxID=586396 RepID=A0AAV0HFI3_9ROSI|nr:unnamed protein product [Linum tenue]
MSRGGGGGIRTTSFHRKSSSETACLVVGCVTMKGLFKPRSRTPVELVQHLRELILFALRNPSDVPKKKREDKMAELGKTLVEIRTILFGEGQSEPNAEACSQLTQEFFREDTIRILIVCIPKLDLGSRQIAARVITNLQKQKVQGRLVAPQYMESNLDLLDILLPGYADDEIALPYGLIARELICHQVVAKYVLESEHMRNFFEYIQIETFEISSDAQATFKELLTRHKSTVAEFLTNNFDWLLGDMLLDRSNMVVMVRYVSSLDNMRIMMNLFREEKKSIQMEAFHVFKLFVANQSKPPEIIGVLIQNKNKLLRFLAGLTTEKEDEQFEADKSQVIREIATLDTRERAITDSDNEAES